jgi:Ser/Thr protein kinase RdoA (MazF antagonist)
VKAEARTRIEAALQPLLRRRMGEPALTIRPAAGQGNHLTYLACTPKETCFIRIEDGPEQDDYMEIEARVLDEARKQGVPTPQVFLVDSSRTEQPFAYQVLEFLDYPDLNRLYKEDRLSLGFVARKIGENLAQWQFIQPRGFGPFDPEALRTGNKLVGLHSSYEAYFRRNWERHLDFLTGRQFLSPGEAEEMRRLIDDRADLLHLEQGCLVHKDLALWNILGTPGEIKAFIDWDDTIGGDPMDDLSLLACFHPADVIAAAVEGYQSVRPLPSNAAPRFYLHLMRNMVVKAVIRVGAGYFDRPESFFLIAPGGSGTTLKSFTRERLVAACRGLRENREIVEL